MRQAPRPPHNTSAGPPPAPPPPCPPHAAGRPSRRMGGVRSPSQVLTQPFLTSSPIAQPVSVPYLPPYSHPLPFSSHFSRSFFTLMFFTSSSVSHPVSVPRLPLVTLSRFLLFLIGLFLLSPYSPPPQHTLYFSHDYITTLTLSRFPFRFNWCFLSPFLHPPESVPTLFLYSSIGYT